MYKVGNIILVKFPFTNLADFKLRPALIIGEYAPKEVLLGNKNDYIILAISSNKDNGINSKIDSSDLSSGELLVKSYIKINKITSIEKSIIYSKIGSVKKKILKKVKKKFIDKILDIKI